MAAAVALLGLILSLGVQALAWRGLNPSKPVGDEPEYLSAERNSLWARVPLHGWLLRGLARVPDAPQNAALEAVLAGMVAITLAYAPQRRELN